MKILVTGADGQLGWEVRRQGKHFDSDIIAAGRLQTDITDIKQVETMIADSRPSIVINAAAYTAVDAAETDKKHAFAVNSNGPENLASCCAKENIPLIHISTDFVFDGKKGAPYVETDPISPTGIYAKSKAEGEAAVSSRTERHIIIRTAWLYGFHGHNFVKTMLRIGKERDVIRVVADQYGSPTSAADLAEAVLTIAGYIRDNDMVRWGTYHYCGQGITTWHGFAQAIFEFAGQYEKMRTPDVEAIPTEEYPTPAKRPAFSALDCTLIQKNFGISPKPWRESLKNTIERILSDRN